MENEEIKQPTALEEEAGMVKAYQDLQANSVSKEKYEHDINELKEKNAIYLKAITDGGKIPTSDDNSGSLEESIADLSKFRGTNLEYWQKMTSTTDKLLKRMPESEIVNTIGTEGFDTLIKVNESMKSMVENADGDSDRFRILYRDNVKDSAPRISTEIDKAGGLVNYLKKK